MNATDDTIVAVGSPPGRSARGMLRVSGPGVMTIVGGLLAPPDSDVDQLQAWPSPRRVLPCNLRLPASTVEHAEVDTDTPTSVAEGGVTNTDQPNSERLWLTLPALITYFVGPRSYTGQDMAELQCPGNPTLINRLLHRIVELGARPAQAGEFTFRAFLAGKLDLTQAEGVAATISATSDSELRAATLLRRGRLGRFASELADRLADQLALVEAGIDFVDQEDVVPIGPDRLDDNLASIARRIDDLLSHSRSWEAIEALPRVVLVGRPSSGKSTLFNTLLGTHRAVVSPTAHTTRDVLIEPLTLHDPSGRASEVMLVDLAGLDTPVGTLAREAQAAAHDAIAQADLILLLSDSPPTETADPPGWRFKPGTPVIRVRTKADLSPDGSPPDTQHREADVAVSAATGSGLDQLRALIAHRLSDRAVSLSGQMLTLQPRHESALRSAADHLQEARRIVTPQRRGHALLQVELIAAELRHTLDDLGALAGRMAPDDVLGRVFSTFCIGK